MAGNNLLGKWKLVRDGSDFLPGLDSLNDSPLALKLLGNNDIECYKIEKRKYLDIEELHFTYITKNVSISRSYQLGTINYESIGVSASGTNEVTLSIIQNCDDNFLECTIVRIGPKVGQQSREIFQYSSDTGLVRVLLDLTTADGTRINMTKYLSRSILNYINSDDYRFSLLSRTSGWRLHEYWPSTVLFDIKINIIKALKVKGPIAQSKEKGKVLECAWKSNKETSGGQESIDFRYIPLHFGDKSCEGEEFMVFLLKVELEGRSWVVPRRYCEFDALRQFLLTQNSFNAELQALNANFPGKTMMLRKSVLDKRVSGLQDFLGLYLEKARYCRQTSIDALCGFLQVPENLYSQESVAFRPVPALLVGANAGSRTLNPQVSPKKGSESSAMPAPAPVSAPQVATATAAAGKATSQANSSPSKPLAPPTAAPYPMSKAVSAPPSAVFTASAASTTSSSTSKSSAPSTQDKLVPVKSTTAAMLGMPEMTMAQKSLVQLLGKGISVIKHGRQGAPKTRILTCDDDGTYLLIQADNHYKKVPLDDVLGIRIGTDVDPATPKEILDRLKEADAMSETGSVTGSVAGSTAGGAPPSRGLGKKRSSIFRSNPDDGVLYGTAILRRTCKPENMKLCISLISADRTFDIQCQRVEDLQALREILPRVIGKK